MATVSDNGTYRWFDHRTHSMEKGIPPQVKDPSERTKIFDWNVPMEVGGAPVAAIGTLEWVPEAELLGRRDVDRRDRRDRRRGAAAAGCARLC